MALLGAVPISLFVLGLFCYWFGVADRYAIFLYGHVAPGIPGAQPFDEMTSSRYWMSGLVASGVVMVVYTALNWALGRIAARCQRDYSPPVWWQVWVLCAIPLIVGIPAITMTVNSPTLPPGLAAACVVATVGGLAFALLPGSWAARRPLDLLWLACDGAGLMPALLLLRAIELPGRGLSVSGPVAILFAFGGTLAGVVWLGVMTGLRVWRQKSLPGASALFVAGVCQSYLLMPLVHYLLATPPAYHYITTASNFFAFSVGLQILTVVVAAGLAIGVTQLRRWLSDRRSSSINQSACGTGSGSSRCIGGTCG
jgi:hypothetical protein